MERQKCVWFTTVLLLAVINSALGEKPAYAALGQSLVLTIPDGVTGPFESIAWKHGENLVVDWVKDTPAGPYFEPFKGRTTLDTNTGRLEIRDVTTDDVAVYSADVGNKAQVVIYRVQLVNRVSKPTVHVQPLSCNPLVNPSCKVTCDGDTADTGPVTYSWKKGDGDWKVLGKDLNITNTEDIRVKTFSCKMKNVANEEESEPEKNPFFQEKPPESSNIPTIIAVVCVVLILVVGVGVGYWKRDLIQERLCPSKGEYNNPTEHDYENGDKSHRGVNAAEGSGNKDNESEDKV